MTEYAIHVSTTSSKDRLQWCEMQKWAPGNAPQSSRDVNHAKKNKTHTRSLSSLLATRTSWISHHSGEPDWARWRGTGLAPLAEDHSMPADTGAQGCALFGGGAGSGAEEGGLHR